MKLEHVVPGLAALHSYDRKDLPYDLIAGLSVAAVAVAIAYAELAGFNPVVGLYSSILPLIVHAIFSTSNHPEPAGLSHWQRQQPLP